ncbi:hydrolase or metal-binding protein [Undibacterium sp. Xuan67W]|uniref:recombination directionality factor n=1 Tax=Undibacterium sp. Xuan67W TaxID=3413057 RepID=UPI003BF34533
MIKGLSITPPVLGRISIGKVVEKNGKRLPEKDDQFTITSQVQNRDGWVVHPLDTELRNHSANGKLRSIPVKLLFNDPDLNLRANYCLFDRQTGRPLCVGNGESCRRYTETGMQSLPCPSPDECELAQGGLCKPYGRLNVSIGDEDTLGSFIFRTTGYNSIRTLAARLHYYQAVSGNLLACLPLELKLRGKSTTMSHRSAIFYVDLTVRDSKTIEQTITDAKQLDQQRKESGYDQTALDLAARAGFGNGAFEENAEEILEMVLEFFPVGDEEGSVDISDAPTTVAAIDVATQSTQPLKKKPSLLQKLDRKVSGLSATNLSI